LPARRVIGARQPGQSLLSDGNEINKAKHHKKKDKT
jgi:hypothetical protein